jgi:hypothetical protein
MVFVFNITQGAFGGPRPMPVEEALAGLLDQVAQDLLQGGCVVGFGDIDSGAWRVPVELDVPTEQQPSTISRLWVERPEEFKFLVFALRESRALVV